MMDENSEIMHWQTWPTKLTGGDVLALTNEINRTFQLISLELRKLISTHQYPASPLPSKYTVTVKDVEKNFRSIKLNTALDTDGILN